LVVHVGSSSQHRPIQDRALLLVDFVGAFRRSEMVSLDVADLKFTSEACW
jgi:site-specific recombinase XerC